ncbi:GAF domain-containing protein [Desulfonatronum thiosulfatophilum]|uniref:GAF domain-containing protein n=1 Tax=Desulfonatronum thiosulfatophilum TaxID=617002 RepID=A0A1G6EIH7_9BACT|nr:GAF and ANTAR domain-containing protein [Desulfonatronum thiosulfatophilum]SDB57156.1 GAF domain-containing protein [Desulfonatronum thiosulfatophilum]
MDSEKFSEDADKVIKALMDISCAINSDLYLEDILRLIVMVTAKVTGVEICSLWLVEDTDNGKKLRIKSTQTIEPAYLLDRELNINEGVVGHVAAHKKPLIVYDVLSEPLFKEKKMARKLGLKSMVSVPLLLKDHQVVGVLNCFSSIYHHFSDCEVNLITTVANQAAVAIYNSELLIKTKVIREELETRKLVDRAKEILMRRSEINEEEAYRWMRKKSMDSRKTMRRIAEAILLSEEIY